MGLILLFFGSELVLDTSNYFIFRILKMFWILTGLFKCDCVKNGWCKMALLLFKMSRIFLVWAQAVVLEDDCDVIQLFENSLFEGFTNFSDESE